MSDTANAPVNIAMRDTPLGREAAGLDLCVHCGFCLNACPTYLALEDENDSPRGRLVLMRALLDGDVALDDPTAATHLNRCLGCRACETACPSGVPYGHLLEATRATTAKARPLPFAAKLVLRVFARPGLLKIALTFARAFRATRIPALLGRIPSGKFFPFAMLASTIRPTRRSSASTPRGDESLGSVQLLTGCVMEGLFAPVNRATERVLGAQGYQVVPPARQVCCGALHAHAGDDATARELAKKNIDAFERRSADYIAINSAGCGAMVKSYAHLLRDEPEWAERARAVADSARDVSELLAAAGPLPARHAPLRVTYDAPCHLQHAQRVVAAPLAALRAMDGLELVPLPGSDQCCGSAGIFNLVEPDVAAAVLRPKIAAIEGTGATVVATGNPGCLMQIGAGLLRSGSLTVARHPVELMAEAYDGDG